MCTLHILASRDELHIRKMKLDYQEVGECPTEVQALWEKKLNVPCRTKVQWDKDEIHTALCQGNCNITPTHIIIQKLLYQYLSISDFLLVRSTEINPLILYNLLCIHARVVLCKGVPKCRRGEVWLLLSQQYRLRHRLPQRQQPPDTPYQDLLKQLTTQQHAILVDLGTGYAS